MVLRIVCAEIFRTFGVATGVTTCVINWTPSLTCGIVLSNGIVAPAAADATTCVKAFWIVSPGFLMPGPITCNVVHVLTHEPAVAKPAE